MLPSSSPQALSEPRQKKASSFEKVLLSAGNEWSGDIEEDKVGSNWIGTGSSVREVMDILEYVLQESGHQDLQKVRNSKRVLHDVKLNEGVRLVHKALALPVSSDVFCWSM
jgi:hypothetical protein